MYSESGIFKNTYYIDLKSEDLSRSFCAIRDLGSKHLGVLYAMKDRTFEYKDREMERSFKRTTMGVLPSPYGAGIHNMAVPTMCPSSEEMHVIPVISLPFVVGLLTYKFHSWKQGAKQC